MTHLGHRQPLLNAQGFNTQVQQQQRQEADNSGAVNVWWDTFCKKPTNQ
jgi:hypothetical protein